LIDLVKGPRPAGDVWVATQGTAHSEEFAEQEVLSICTDM